jgi:hypothetical protein
MAAAIEITENGERKRVTDIAPYVAEARAIEDKLAAYFRQVGAGDRASLAPHLPELRKLDARRSVLQSYFDVWAVAARDDELIDLEKRVNDAIASRPKP